MTILFKNGCKALSVTRGDSSPKERATELSPRYTAYWHEKWSVSVPIRSITCFSTAHQKGGRQRLSAAQDDRAAGAAGEAGQELEGRAHTAAGAARAKLNTVKAANIS